MNEESWMRGQQTYPLTIHFLTCEQEARTSAYKLKALLAAALSPFVSLLYPPNPWCEWCDVWRLTTTPGSTSPTLFEQWCGFFYVPQEPDKCKCCGTAPTVFRPYPRRLESLTICRCKTELAHSLSNSLLADVITKAASVSMAYIIWTPQINTVKVSEKQTHN